MENNVQNNVEWKKLLHITEILALLIFLAAGISYYLWGDRSGAVVYDRSVANKIIEPMGGSSAIAPQSTVEKFIVQDTTPPPQTPAQIEAAKAAVTSAPETLKAPEVFKSFDYDATRGKAISITGICHDKYYTLLIFANAVDYRKDPAAARVNSAFDCPASGNFTISLDVNKFNLQTGSYYLFVADQGTTGSWYNPR
jgi:hypothetical protein